MASKTLESHVFLDDEDWIELSNVPPSCDDRWISWSAPFVSFVAKPKSWPELVEFGKTLGHEPNFTRQIIAWMSLKDRIGVLPGSRPSVKWQLIGQRVVD